MIYYRMQCTHWLKHVIGHEHLDTIFHSIHWTFWWRSHKGGGVTKAWPLVWIVSVWNCGNLTFNLEVAKKYVWQFKIKWWFRGPHIYTDRYSKKALRKVRKYLQNLTKALISDLATISVSTTDDDTKKRKLNNQRNINLNLF